MLALDQQALERRTLARNEVLFRQGDKVTAIYFIEVGRLRLERRTFDGRTLILGTTAANEFFVTPLHYHVWNSGARPAGRGASHGNGGQPVTPVHAGRGGHSQTTTPQHKSRHLPEDTAKVRAVALTRVGRTCVRSKNNNRSTGARSMTRRS